VSAEKQDSDDKSEIYVSGGVCDMAGTCHSKLKNCTEQIQGVKQTSTDYINVSGDMCKTICLRKLFVKESENIHLGNAEHAKGGGGGKMC
jgi:hypothetical protein